MIAEREAEFGGEWFAEAYIDGREFNLALLDGDGACPIAEILFTDHAGDTPRIVGYAEKWDDRQPRLRRPRRASSPPREEPLFAELERLARAAWDALRLTRLRPRRFPG